MSERRHPQARSHTPPEARWAGELVDRSRNAAALLWRSRTLLRLTPFDVSTEEGRSLERYRRIALTTASGFSVRAVTTLIGLVTVPLVLGHLGKERYGLWSTISTLVAWVALFDLGLSNGLVNCLARAHGRGDHEEATRYFTTALLSMVGLALLLALGMVSTFPLVPWPTFLGASGQVDDATVSHSVAAALSVFIVAMPLGIVPQLFAGIQRSYVNNFFTGIGAIVGLAALVAAIQARAPMPALILAAGSSSLVTSLLGLWYALGPGMPWLRVRLRHVSSKAFREITSRSVPMFLFQAGALAVNESQSIILAQRCGLATVADYGIAFRLYLLVASLIQLGTNSFLPPIREAHERGDTAWTRTAFRRLVWLRLGIAAGGALGMMLLGNVILRFWLRRDDVWFGWQVWAVLALMQIAAAWVSSYTELLWIMDKVWVLVGLVLLNGAVTVTLTWLLAPGSGVLGAFVATSVTTLAVNTWAVPLLARSVLRRP